MLLPVRSELCAAAGRVAITVPFDAQLCRFPAFLAARGMSRPFRIGAAHFKSVSLPVTSLLLFSPLRLAVSIPFRACPSLSISAPLTALLRPFSSDLGYAMPFPLASVRCPSFPTRLFASRIFAFASHATASLRISKAEPRSALFAFPSRCQSMRIIAIASRCVALHIRRVDGRFH